MASDTEITVRVKLKIITDFEDQESDDERVFRFEEPEIVVDEHVHAGSHAELDAKLLVRSLSPRELQTLKLVVSGQPTKAIAKELGLSPRTVEIYRAAAFRKIDAHSTADAVRIGTHAGLDTN